MNEFRLTWDPERGFCASWTDARGRRVSVSQRNFARLAEELTRSAESGELAAELLELARAQTRKRGR